MCGNRFRFGHLKAPALQSTATSVHITAEAEGHQVVLAEGENTIALAVIAADKSVQTYTIVVRRPAN